MSDPNKIYKIVLRKGLNSIKEIGWESDLERANQTAYIYSQKSKEIVEIHDGRGIIVSKVIAWQK